MWLDVRRVQLHLYIQNRLVSPKASMLQVTQNLTGSHVVVQHRAFLQQRAFNCGNADTAVTFDIMNHDGGRCDILCLLTGSLAGVWW